MAPPPSRLNSLLAWLAPFDERVRYKLEEDEASAGAGDFAVSCLATLRDGQVLFHVLDQLYDSDLSAAMPGELKERPWPIILSRLAGMSRTTTTGVLRAVESGDTDGVEHWLPNVLEALLGTAVGPNAPGRQRSIHQILSLPAAHQEQLKAVIEQHLTRVAASDGGDENGDCEVHADADGEGQGHRHVEPAVLLISTSIDDKSGVTTCESEQARRDSCSTDADRASCETSEGDCSDPLESPVHVDHAMEEAVAVLEGKVQHLRDENEELRLAEAAATEREQKARKELEEMRRSFLCQSLSGEVQALEKESGYKEELTELARKLAAADKRVAQLEGGAAAMAKLQDEVDVLRPAAQRLAKSEEALAKCKEKLQVLQDVKERLVEEQAAHAELLEKTMHQERELQQLPSLKRQVESYKQGTVESEMELRELGATLAESQKDVTDLRQHIANLSEALDLAQKRTVQVEQELEAARSRHAVDQDGGLGVGEGVSECNPAVVKRMRELEEEVERLSGQVSQTNVDRVEQLETELDDAKRLAGSFEDKFRRTRAELDAERTVVARLEKDMEDLHDIVAEMESEAAEACRQAQESSRVASEEIAALKTALQEASEGLAMSQAEIEQRVVVMGTVTRRQHQRMSAAAALRAMGMRALVQQLNDEGRHLRAALVEMTERFEAEVKTRQGAEHCVLLIREQAEEHAKAMTRVLQDERVAAEATLQQCTEQAMAALKEKDEEHKRAMHAASERMREYVDAHKVSNNQHRAEIVAAQRALELEQQRCAGQALEIDELRMVQKRLEREKHFMLEEARTLRKELAKAGTGGAQTAATVGPAAAVARGSVLQRQFEQLRDEYERLLQDFRRTAVAIRSAETGIGFSLRDFSPGNDVEEYEQRPRLSTKGYSSESSGSKGGLHLDFESARTPSEDAMGGYVRPSHKTFGRHLMTPPDRVPVAPAMQGYEHRISQLTDDKRLLMLDRASATAMVMKLEASVAELQSKLSDKDHEIGSLNYKLARASREVDRLTEEQCERLVEYDAGGVVKSARRPAGRYG